MKEWFYGVTELPMIFGCPTFFVDAQKLCFSDAQLQEHVKIMGIKFKS